MLFEDDDQVSKLEASLYRYHCQFDVLPLPKGLNFSHKWIAASALQKSIRRGNSAMAYKAARTMMQINPASVWNRLRVIACEDIGIGDMDAVFKTLYMSGKVQWRKRNGGDDHVLAYIIECLCNSTKSRLADDILYVADVHDDYQTQRMEYVDYSPDQLCDIILFDDERDIFERMIALCYLHGTERIRPQRLIEKKGNPASVIDVFKQTGMPTEVLDTIRMALSRTEGHALSLGLALLLQSSASNHEIIYDKMGNATISEWSAEAYDKHTREGKQAYSKFLNRCPQVRSFIQNQLPQIDPVTMIGWCLFALEAQRLDKRIAFDGSEEINLKAQSAWMQCAGMTPQIQFELLHLVKSHMEILNDCRG